MSDTDLLLASIRTVLAVPFVDPVIVAGARMSRGTARAIERGLTRDMHLRNRFVASPAALIARGAPTEEVLASELRIEMTGDLRERFEAECATRGCEPAELLADVLTAVARDNLFAAVIDI